MALQPSDNEFKERLINTVKKEVKQIMEEAVTRKFVHQDSSSVTSLCAAVESCLSHGLRRRALGLFRSSSTTALMHKVAKCYLPAKTISNLILDAESEEGRSASSGDSTTRMVASSGGVGRPPLLKRSSSSWLTRSSSTTKYLWIRLALFERILVGIIEHIVDNNAKYYEKEALVADPEYGSVLSHLLVGPCALEYTRMKTQDHYWTDPPADELVKRHRISSSAPIATSSPANRGRPGLNYRKIQPGGSNGDGESGMGSGRSSTAKDYVESLHQNNKNQLLYGKNNVLVLPMDLKETVPGYLSLHHSNETLTLKWTPNQLMNGAVSIDGDSADKSAYWDHALHVCFSEIVYVHCHHQQGPDGGGTMVLVGQDGVQRPAIHFPAGGHLLAFLTCLETGLHPQGRLDPPLWSQTGKGKIFPKIQRKGTLVGSCQSVNENVIDNGNGDYSQAALSSDYVFRIIYSNPDLDILDDGGSANATPSGIALQGTTSPRSPRWWPLNRHRPFRSSESTSSTSSSKSLNASLSLAEASVYSNSVFADSVEYPRVIQRGESLQVLCDTMKRQIISRAFYGWLAHCRHLRTVRTHLSGLVNEKIVSCQNPCDAREGINDQSWDRLMKQGVLIDSFELFRLTFYGGVAHHLRKQVWPYLLGHYPFGSTGEERQAQDRAMQATYETTMSEWLAVEAIIRQRDREATAASIAKLSLRSQSGEQCEAAEVAMGRSMSNEVFDESSLDENDTDGCEPGKENLTRKAVVTGDASLPHQPVPDEQATQTLDCMPVVHRGEDVESPNGSSTLSSETVVDVTINDAVDDNRETESNRILHSQPQITTLEAGEDEINGDATSSFPSGINATISLHNLAVDDGFDRCSIGSHSSCVSPVSSQGGVYSMQLLETYGLNLHRIDKDVQRCDRNYAFFTQDNLDKLRNVMCTYVWCHLEKGYMQGMCDLVAPLLVIIEDEALTYACFCELMKRMGGNFPHPHEGTMDHHFANMRSLIQILDAELFDLMHQNGDYTHFYFCYRWFLLDFKRELVYDDVFAVWETIWAARTITSSHFVLFVALALVEYYRDIILANAMDFTDIIKFFNEMAERHDAKAVLRMARDFVLQLQTLIENK